MVEKMRERRTAREIASMLKAAAATLTNDREGHPLHSYQRNRLGPGIAYSIELIGSGIQAQRTTNSVGAKACGRT